MACIWLDSCATNKTRLLLFHMEFFCVVTDKQYSEAIFMKKKNGQNLAQSSRKWHKKYQIGESGGERKKNPSANPAFLSVQTAIFSPKSTILNEGETFQSSCFDSMLIASQL